MSIRTFRRFLLDRIVLQPTRDAMPCGDQQRRTFQSQLGTLEYFVHTIGPNDASPDLLVVKFPGTGGRAERSSRFPVHDVDRWPAPPESAQVLTWNPSGYGASEGKATLAGIAQSAQELLVHVLGQLPPPEHAAQSPTLWLCGNSLGCNPALLLARSDRMGDQIDGLILRNPPPLIDVVNHVASRYPLGRLMRPVAESLIDDMNATVNAPHARVPALFLRSEKDTLVLPEVQQQLLERYAGETRLVSMDGLDHAGIPTPEHEERINQGLSWLWQQRQRKPSL